VIILSVAALAAVLAAGLYLSLPLGERRAATRQEFATIFLEAGVIGALGLALKWLLGDWVEAKARAEVLAKTTAEQKAARQRYLSDALLELRKRFRLAIGRMTHEDRSEYPWLWALLLLEGEGNSSWPEKSQDLIGRIRLLLPETGGDPFMRALDEIDKILAETSRRRGVPDKVLEGESWSQIKGQLQHGYHLVDELFWVSSLGRELKTA
jgi:hypothetical protein